MFGLFGRRGYGNGDILDEMLEIDEIEDLERGDFDGAMEDELIRDIF